MIGSPTDIVIDIDVARPRRGAGGTLQFDTRTRQDVLKGCVAHVAPRTGDSEVHRVHQPITGFAFVCQSGDAYRVSNLHSSCRGFYETTVAAIGGACVQGAADLGGAGIHVAHQHDAPTFVGNGLRLDRAAVSHHTAHQHTGTSRGHQDEATVGSYHVFIFYQGVHHAFINLQGGEALAAEDQGGFVAPSHGDGAFTGDDDALVAHLRSEQGDVAAKRGLQRPHVHDTAGFAITLVGAFTGHEVGVADAVGGDQEAADINLRGSAEQHTVGVDNKDLPWGVDTPHDLAGVVVQHAVEGDGRGVGLIEINLRPRANVEGVPVDGSALAALLHRQGVARTADGRAPAHHLAALGQLRGRRCCLRLHHAQAQQTSGKSQDVQGAGAELVHVQNCCITDNQKRSLCNVPSRSNPLAWAAGLVPMR